MLSARNIENGFINWDAKYRFISETDFDQENKRTEAKDNDVLLTIVGTIGRSCVIPKNSQLFTLQRSVAVIKVDGINSKFLCYQLQSPNVQNYLINNAKGTAQKGIYLGKLGKLPILVAPEDQQKQIVAKIEELFSHIDAGVVALQKAKQLLKQYRQSVLKAAVTGQLTREWREQNTNKLEPASELLKRILAERRSKWEEQQLQKFKALKNYPKIINGKRVTPNLQV
jgi:type I restriction enzyme S subunit